MCFLEASNPPPTDCKHVAVVSFEIKQHVLLRIEESDEDQVGLCIFIRHTWYGTVKTGHKRSMDLKGSPLSGRV